VAVLSAEERQQWDELTDRLARDQRLASLDAQLQTGHPGEPATPPPSASRWPCRVLADLRAGRSWLWIPVLALLAIGSVLAVLGASGTAPILGVSGLTLVVVLLVIPIPLLLDGHTHQHAPRSKWRWHPAPGPR
jgi:amino acid transporter